MTNHPILSRRVALVTTTLLATLMAGTSIQAQTILDDIVIESATLSGEDQKLSETSQSYSVLTREQLEARQVKNATEALRGLPGVQIDQIGTPGNIGAVRIRGAESNHTKILIDGVEVNGLNDGAFDLSTLLIADIERVEVLRGPQSGIYGGNALSGVINFITRKGRGPAQATIALEGGSFDTIGMNANVSGGNEQGYLSVSGAWRESNSFNIAGSGTEADGFQKGAFFARGGFAFSDMFRIDMIGRYQRNFSNIDSDIGPGFGDNIVDDVAGFTNERAQTLGRVTTTLNWLGDRLVTKAYAEAFQDEFADVSNFSRTSDELRRRFGSRTTAKFGTGIVRHQITLAYENTEETFNSSNIVGSRTREQDSYIGEYRAAIADRLFLDANVRRDDNSVFEDVTTYRLGASYKLLETGTRFHGSYGTGIQNPSFVEQFGFFGNFVGNPSLQPEKSTGWDVGVEQTLFNRRLLVDVTYFDADLTDEITADFSNFPAPAVPFNQAGVSTRNGVEVKVVARPIVGLSLSASYTYTDAKNPDGTKELRRPRHSGGFDATYRFAGNRALLNAGVNYTGNRDDVGLFFATTELDAYWVASLRGSYKVTDQMELYGRVENVFDEEYEEIFSYQTAGTAAYVGVRFKFAESAPAPQALK